MVKYGILTILATCLSLSVTIAFPHEKPRPTRTRTLTTTTRLSFGDDNIIIKRDYAPSLPTKSKRYDSEEAEAEIAKRQYIYVTTTAPTTLTYTSTVYQTVTSQPVYTEYATATVTETEAAFLCNSPNNHPRHHAYPCTCKS